MSISVNRLTIFFVIKGRTGVLCPFTINLFLFIHVFSDSAFNKTFLQLNNIITISYVTLKVVIT